MTVIDNRRSNATTTFGDLPIGGAFLGNDINKFCIKTDLGAAMMWVGHWKPIYDYSAGDAVVPLEVTYSFANKEGK